MCRPKINEEQTTENVNKCMFAMRNCRPKIQHTTGNINNYIPIIKWREITDQAKKQNVNSTDKRVLIKQKLQSETSIYTNQQWKQPKVHCGEGVSN